jgi:hypothetical protein
MPKSFVRAILTHEIVDGQDCAAMAGSSNACRPKPGYPERIKRVAKSAATQQNRAFLNQP